MNQGGEGGVICLICLIFNLQSVDGHMYWYSVPLNYENGLWKLLEEKKNTCYPLI